MDERVEQDTARALEWDRHFLALAAECAKMSKDPSSRVGAVAVRLRRILATGFNGFPPGLRDDARLHDRDAKLPRIVHAEQNVIAWAAREGVALAGATLYVTPYHPCTTCAKLLVAAGISEVVFRAGDVPSRWADDFATAADILDEADVLVRAVRL